jgi:hypothetical protein
LSVAKRSPFRNHKVLVLLTVVLALAVRSSFMLTIRRCSACLAAVVGLVIAQSGTTEAQQNPPPAAPSSSQPVGRSFYVEGALTVALMAAAGFAISRPSNRS